MGSESRDNFNLVLPMGTQVVTRVEARAGGKFYPCGAVGVVVEAPVDNSCSYLVRLPDDTIVALRREGFSIRKHARGKSFRCCLRR